MRGFIALLLASALLSCAGPPPEDYVGGTSAAPGSGIGLGANASGEACTQQAQGNGADIFCGTWQQPAGHVRRAESPTAPGARRWTAATAARRPQPAASSATCRR